MLQPIAPQSLRSLTMVMSLSNVKPRYDFSAGPAMLPDSVLAEASKAVIDWQDTGTSILTLNHRSEAYYNMATDSVALVRQLLNVPANYEIMFLTGGATQHFAMVPLNLADKNATVHYLDSGHWAKKAINTAKSFLNVETTKLDLTKPISAQKITLSPKSAYVHLTPNETIDGVAYDDLPDVGDIPIVADMSSCLFSRPLDIAKFGLIYAGAQKNFGTSGVSLVIIRHDLLVPIRKALPPLNRYETFYNNVGIFNTPSVFSCYLSYLMLQWVAEKGGVTKMLSLNQRKAHALYAVLDQCQAAVNLIPHAYRSMMNVVFQFNSRDKETAFFQRTAAAGLIGLHGHRSVGGARASLYNAMPLAGVKQLSQLLIPA